MANKDCSQRLSNFELLRIIAMFMVLMVHANFWAIGAPTIPEIHSMPTTCITRLFFEAISISCVNIFVMISGWFGIRPKLKSFCSFTYQILFFTLGIYLIMIALGLTVPNTTKLASCFLLLDHQWFVKTYLILYIFSPVLNSFSNNATEKQQCYVIVSFFIFQFIYGWLSNGATFIMSGYSPISFFGLYLLAQYIRNFPIKIKNKPILFDIIIIVASVSLIISLSLLSPHILNRMYSYTNPLVIVLSTFTIILFSKINIKNSIINYIAASAFAVYLFHSNYCIAEPYFKSSIIHIYNSYNGPLCITMIGLFISSVYILATIIDQIRKFSWNLLIKVICSSNKN